MENKEIVIDGITYVPKGSEITKKATPNKKGLEYCIVRTYSAGVFAGYYDRKNNKSQEGTIYNSRRIWYWDGANSLSELAINGTAKPQNCKFPCEIEETDLKQIIEIIPCTEKAKLSIQGVKIWQQ
jgi:hypothetical protein